MGPDLLLASRSPRRRELLEQIGVRYACVDVEVDEMPARGETPADFVLRLAREKARAGRRGAGGDLPVLPADTAVVAGDDILGKPRDEADALRMMRLLSGRGHRVLTGVALVAGSEHTRLSETRVWFRDVTEGEARAYWRSGEPADKAGGYAVQGLGALFIRWLEGSYSGVMGLPLYETGELLQYCGIQLIDRSQGRP
ncbi:MAG TPA: septum formation inhibitor Maf [Chromatiales bacterium]|nr:septum formation inhibitor Maf [Chromatiales bacterium]